MHAEHIEHFAHGLCRIEIEIHEKFFEQFFVVEIHVPRQPAVEEHFQRAETSCRALVELALIEDIICADTLKKLIATEQSEEADPKALRKQLNEQYDAFVSKYGTLNRNKALDDVFAEDYEHNLPLSLEEVSRVPSATGKSMVWQVKKGKGILDRRVSYPVIEPVTADNLQDAVNISLSYKGTLDIPYMARLMDVTEEQVTDEILEQGAAYRDPITGVLVDRDTYLSGNVHEKLEEAREASESNPEYQKNVEDLMSVQPETIRFGDISYRLGTPWIPTEYINDFAENVLGITGADVRYDGHHRPVCECPEPA